MAPGPWSRARVTAVTLTALLVVTVPAGAALRVHRDHRAYVGEAALMSALLTFRPSEQAGAPANVEPADLGPTRTTRTAPPRCSPLTQLAVEPPTGAASWTGINGSPPRPVRLLTVRFADADTARAELRAKRIASLACRRLAVTFPPFDAPAEIYTVRNADRLWDPAFDAVSYRLIGDGRSFEFYVRRYGNTLTWTYADDVSTPALRHQVADQLISRLTELSRES